MAQLPSWEGRDLPVLRAFVEIYEETHRRVTPEQISARSGLALDDVNHSIQALDDSGRNFFRPQTAWGGILWIDAPTEATRRAAGDWPSNAEFADRLIAAFELASKEADTEEKRSRAKAIWKALAEGGRDLAIEVAATVITKSAGM